MTELEDSGPGEPDADAVVTAVAAWARPFLSGDAPVFGSLEWLRLRADDPQRAAAVVRAALAWWRVGVGLDELAASETADDKASSVAISADLAAMRTSDPYRPTGRELRAGRDWHARRGDTPDHPGGPVPAWGPEERRAAG